MVFMFIFLDYPDLLDEEVMVVPFDVKDIGKHQTLIDEIIAYFGRVSEIQFLC